LHRVDPPAVPKTAYAVACSGEEPPQVGPASRGFSVTFFPYPKQVPWSPATLKCTEIVDGRYSDMSTVTSDTPRVTNTGSQITVNVELTTYLGKQGRFKAAYVVWWDAPMAVSVISPGQAQVGARTTVHLHAQDGRTGATVPCQIFIGGQFIGNTDTSIPYIFEE